jgi:antitoxin component YwqK of YwqJK toxin-antitoxin module
MKSVFILSFWFLFTQFSIGQVDTILIRELDVTIDGLPVDVNDIIVGSDYTFLQEYNPSTTLFYYKKAPFTGVAQKVDTIQITYIGFKNGIIHGRWYDVTIWNNYLSFEGNYVNGKMSGEWVEGIENKIYRKRNYEEGKLNGISKSFIDFKSREDSFYELNNQPIERNAIIEEVYTNDELVSETYFFENGEKLDGEIKFSMWNIETLDTLTQYIEFYKDGKFRGKRSYCYESDVINSEFHILETGVVENKEIDCNTGEIMLEGIFIPKKVFTSHSFIFEDEFYERQ